VAPDILAAAKGLGNGFPVAACLATEKVAAGMTPGTHGSTFGGNPLAMAVASKVVRLVGNEAFLADVRRKGERLRAGLEALAAEYSEAFAEVRGEGLLVGVKAVVPSGDLVAALRDQKLLTVGAGDNVVRFLAPLIVNESEIDHSVQCLERACADLAGKVKQAAAQ